MNYYLEIGITLLSLIVSRILYKNSIKYVSYLPMTIIGAVICTSSLIQALTTVDYLDVFDNNVFFGFAAFVTLNATLFILVARSISKKLSKTTRSRGNVRARW